MNIVQLKEIFSPWIDVVLQDFSKSFLDDYGSDVLEYLHESSQFNPSVLSEKDANGDVIGTWCKAGFKKEDGICFICNKVINCSQHGVTAIKRHALNRGHIESCKKIRNTYGIIKKSTQQQIMFNTPTSSKTHQEKVCAAEIMFCVAVAAYNIPYSFANMATNIFPEMFGDSLIAKDFKCKSSKLSYVISDGIGPFLKEKMLEEISKSQCYFSVQIDETPIAEQRVQQLDILLRYFSEKKEQVVVHHFETCHIGCATADNIVTCVTNSMKCLPENKLISIFSDGPNVMKAFKKRMRNLHPELIDIGECVLHKVHNSFSYALNNFGSDVENLVIDIFYFFKRSSSHSSKLKDVQIKVGLPESVFLRHVSSRWLTLQTSVERVVEQFSVLQEYFKKNDESKSDSQRLNRIRLAFNDKKLFAKLLFLQNVSKVFTNFLRVFQAETPMIHILYDEMINLVKTLMGRFLKEECFRKKQADELKFLDIEKGEYWSKVDIGFDTEKAINSLTEKDKKFVRMGARSFYISSVKYLLKVLPLENKILRNLKCLNPSNRLKEESLNSIKFLASQLPNIIAIEEVSEVCDEFIRLQGEESSNVNITSAEINKLDSFDLWTEEEFETQSQPHICIVPLDKYWSKIFKIKDVKENFKYNKLGKLIKAILSLPHSNADVERGFSINKHALHSQSSLSLESINALRTIKSNLKYDCSNQVEKFVINGDVIKCVQNAYNKKCERINAVQQRKKRKIADDSKVAVEEELRKEGRELDEKLKAAQKMLSTAQETISCGIKTKDMSRVESGQILLTEATSRAVYLPTAWNEHRQEQIPFILHHLESYLSDFICRKWFGKEKAFEAILKAIVETWKPQTVCEQLLGIILKVEAVIIHKNIEKEIESIYLVPVKQNKNVVKRSKSLYTALTYLYNHFCWKICRHEECPNVKKFCVKLLSQIIKTGLIISKGNPESEWIDRILTAIRLFTGESALIYDSLLLINILKRKYHQAYIAVLKCAITSEDQECITDPLVYMVVILLFRRLKCLLSKRSHRAAIVSLVCRIKPPANVIPWLSLLDVQDVSTLKYKTIGKQLMTNFVTKRLIKKIRDIALYCYITKKETSIQETSKEPSDLFVVHSSSTVDHYGQDNKLCTAEDFQLMVAQSLCDPITETSCRPKRHKTEKSKKKKKQIDLSEKSSPKKICEEKLFKQVQYTDIDSCVGVTKIADHKKSKKNKKTIQNRVNNEDKTNQAIKIIEDVQPVYTESTCNPLFKKHIQKKDNIKKCKKRNKPVLNKKNSQKKIYENAEATEKVQPASLDSFYISVSNGKSMEQRNLKRSKRNKFVLSKEILETPGESSNPSITDPPYAASKHNHSIQGDKISKKKKNVKKVQPIDTESFVSVSKKKSKKNKKYHQENYLETCGESSELFVIDSSPTVDAASNYNHSIQDGEICKEKKITEEFQHLYSESYVSVSKMTFKNDHLKKSKKNKNHCQANYFKTSSEPSELFVTDSSPSVDYSSQDGKICVENVQPTCTLSFVPISKNSFENYKSENLKDDSIINIEVDTVEQEIEVIDIADSDSSSQNGSSIIPRNIESFETPFSTSTSNHEVGNKVTISLNSDKVSNRKRKKQKRHAENEYDSSVISCNIPEKLNTVAKNVSKRSKKTSASSLIDEIPFNINTNGEYDLDHASLNESKKMKDKKRKIFEDTNSSFKEKSLKLDKDKKTYDSQLIDQSKVYDLEIPSDLNSSNFVNTLQTSVNLDVSDRLYSRVSSECNLNKSVKLSKTNDETFTPKTDFKEHLSSQMSNDILPSPCLSGVSNIIKNYTVNNDSSEEHAVQFSSVKETTKAHNDALLTISDQECETKASCTFLNKDSKNQSLSKEIISPEINISKQELSSIKQAQESVKDLHSFKSEHLKSIQTDENDESCLLEVSGEIISNINFGSMMHLQEPVKVVSSVKSENMQPVSIQGKVSDEIILFNSNSFLEIPAVNSILPKSSENDSSNRLNRKRKLAEVECSNSVKDSDSTTEIKSSCSRIELPINENKLMSLNSESIENHDIILQNEEKLISVDSEFSCNNNKRDKLLSHNLHSICSLVEVIKSSKNTDELPPQNSVGTHNTPFDMSNKKTGSTSCSSESIVSHESIQVFKNNNELTSCNLETINYYKKAIEVSDNENKSVSYNSKAIVSPNKSINESKNEDESTALNSESVDSHKESVKISDNGNKSISYISEGTVSPTKSINTSKNKDESTSLNSESVDSFKESIIVSNNENKSVSYVSELIINPNKSVNASEILDESTPLISESDDSHKESIKASDNMNKSISCISEGIVSPNKSINASKNKDESTSLNSESVDRHKESITLSDNGNKSVSCISEGIISPPNELINVSEIKDESTSLISESNDSHKELIIVSDNENKSVSYNSEGIVSPNKSINALKSKDESTSLNSESVDGHKESITLSDNGNKSVSYISEGIVSPSKSINAYKNKYESTSHISESVDSYKESIMVSDNENKSVSYISGLIISPNKSVNASEINKESTTLISESDVGHKESFKVSDYRNKLISCISKGIVSPSRSINASKNNEESTSLNSESVDSYKEPIIISNDENTSVSNNSEGIVRPNKSSNAFKNKDESASLNSESVNSHKEPITLSDDGNKSLSYISDGIISPNKSINTSEIKDESTSLILESDDCHKESIKVSDGGNTFISNNSDDIASSKKSINSSKSKDESIFLNSKSIDCHKESIKVFDSGNNSKDIASLKMSINASKNENESTSFISESIHHQELIKVSENRDKSTYLNSNSASIDGHKELIMVSIKDNKSVSNNSEDAHCPKSPINASENEAKSIPYNSESVKSAAVLFVVSKNEAESELLNSETSDGLHDSLKITNKESLPHNSKYTSIANESLTNSENVSNSLPLISHIDCYNESKEESDKGDVLVSSNVESIGSQNELIEINSKKNVLIPPKLESINSQNKLIEISKKKDVLVHSNLESISNHNELTEIPNKEGILVLPYLESVDSQTELIEISNKVVTLSPPDLESVDSQNGTIKISNKKSISASLNSKFIDCQNKEVKALENKIEPVSLFQNEKVQVLENKSETISLIIKSVNKSIEPIKMSKNVDQRMPFNSESIDNHVESIAISENKSKLESHLSSGKTKSHSLNNSILATECVNTSVAAPICKLENDYSEKCIIKEGTLAASTDVNSYPSSKSGAHELENEAATEDKSPNEMQQSIMATSRHDKLDSNCDKSEFSDSSSLNRESKLILKNSSYESIDNVYQVLDDSECAAEFEHSDDDVAGITIPELHITPSKETECLSLNSHCLNKNAVDIENVKGKYSDTSVTELHSTSGKKRKNPILNSPPNKVSYESKNITSSPLNKKLKFSPRTSSNESIDIITVSEEHENNVVPKGLLVSPNSVIEENKSECYLDYNKDSNQYSNVNLVSKTLKITNFDHLPFACESKKYLTFSDISESNKSASIAVDPSVESSNQIRNFAFAATAEIFSSYRNDLFSGEDQVSTTAISKDSVSFYSQELSDDGKSQNLSSEEGSETDHSVCEEIDNQLEEVENNLEKNPADISLKSDSPIEINKEESAHDHDASHFQSQNEQETCAADKNSSSPVSENKCTKDALSKETSTILPKHSVKIQNKADIKRLTVLTENTADVDSAKKALKEDPVTDASKKTIFTEDPVADSSKKTIVTDDHVADSSKKTILNDDHVANSSKMAVLNEDLVTDASRKNAAIDTKLPETGLIKKELSKTGNEKNVSDCDKSEASSSICITKINDHSESTDRILRNSSKKIVFRKIKSKQNSLCGSPPKRYSLRLKKSKDDESLNLGIDISQLHLDSPSSRMNPKVTIKRNDLVAKMLAVEDPLQGTSDHSDITSSNKRETRSTILKSAKDDAVPNTPSYNFRTRRSILAPGKLKL